MPCQQQLVDERFADLEKPVWAQRPLATNNTSSGLWTEPWATLAA